VPPLRHGLTAAAVMNEDAQRRATEFLKELYAAGGIDAGRLSHRRAGTRLSRGLERGPATGARNVAQPQGRNLAQPQGRNLAQPRGRNVAQPPGRRYSATQRRPGG
jgi:hypothetical protein